MSNLDIQYVAELVPQAQAGDSNAFAEIFAATCQKQFAFARSYLKDELLAQEALQNAYIQALKGIPQLREPTLVVAWLNQLTLRSCFRVQQSHRRFAGAEGSPETCNPENLILEINGKAFNVRMVMTLPFSEAQTILLRYFCRMKIGAIASLLEIRRSAVRQYIDSGRRRLNALADMEGGRYS